MTVRDLGRWGRSHGGRKKLRYTAASILSAASGQLLLMVGFGVFRWSALSANLLAYGVAALSSYHLNRVWVWRCRGRSHLLREVLPFWVVAAAGLAISTMSIVLVEDSPALITQSRAVRTVVVMTASFASVILLWLVKFLILDRYVFVRGGFVSEPSPSGIGCGDTSSSTGTGRSPGASE